MKANARDLERELDWLQRVLDARLALYLATGPDDGSEPEACPPPDLSDSDSPYAAFVQAHELGPAERLVLLLALVPHVRPQLLDVLWVRNTETQRGFSEFGGVHGSTHGGFLPTGETAVFLLAGQDLEARFELLRLFDGDGPLMTHGGLQLGSVGPGESRLSGLLSLGREALNRFTTGEVRRPGFGAEFPARRIETELGWDDLVLPAPVLDQLREVHDWMTHGATLLGEWGLGARLRPGYTCLFHGPSGTGKTLAASILGRDCGCDVYRIDLSLVVSKYVGETEKNLARVFELAERRRWILFFDEADALFGRRTRVEDSHDRYANQEVSYLLQRVEEYSGVVILASNLRANIDDAFLRRFQSVVHFALPRPRERLRLWREALPARLALGPGVELERLAERFELSGGTIMNVVRHAALRALARGDRTLRLEDVEEGIRREGLKDGRAF